ncbi:hypothetical protein PICSAR39_03118 [Mycobacterium avium subsp. paratuberculosis]|nr:hypothetical protein PICSAR39_03118 [Mycobacterium avium subsp. paratuberculosis]
MIPVVPIDYVRDGALAVDARVCPEVDQDHLAAHHRRVERFAVRGVEPPGDPGERGRRPAPLQLRRPVGTVGQRPAAGDVVRAQLQRAALGRRRPGWAQTALNVVGAQPVLHRGGVVGDGTLQHRGQVEHQRDGQHDHRDPAGDLYRPLPAAERRDPLGDAPAGQREGQQRQRVSGGERRGQHQRAGADRGGAAGHHDRGKHRSGARHVQRAQRQAQAETVCAGPTLALRQVGERSLDQLLQRREDQSQPDDGQHHQGGPPDRILGQVQRRQQRRADQGGHAEAAHQARDHQVGPRRGAHAAPVAVHAGQQDHRQHRQDARRDPGDQAAEEPDQGDGLHPSSLTRRGGAQWPTTNHATCVIQIT